MDDITRLLWLSLSMLVGCYVAGSIPLAVTLSEDRLRVVTVLGAGLLVGTALAVIIPEGVHALYEQQHIHAIPHSHEHVHSHGEEHDHGTHAEVPSAAALTTVLPEIGSSVELHSLIGISLCLGFVFMLLVDQLSGGHAHSHSPSSDVENGGRRSGKITATIGLVVHAAADGIALGAAVSTSRTDVEMIVFIAIMLHKAPAAFGLSTFLLHEGLGRNKIRRHLLVFASAAPLLALLTYFGLSQSHKEALSTVNGTGIAMLFSAGTFLYVATVHVLPEIGRISNGSNSDSDSSDSHKLRRVDLIIMVVGIISPLLLSTMHHH